jgi:hypothetical protein
LVVTSVVALYGCSEPTSARRPEPVDKPADIGTDDQIVTLREPNGVEPKDAAVDANQGWTSSSPNIFDNGVVKKPNAFSNLKPSPAQTAKEFLRRLASPDYWNPEATDLPDDERKKLVAELRKRYPLISLRKRLDFQATHPKQQQKGLVIWGPKRKSIALEMLHSDTVKKSINESGAGVFRAPPISPDDLKYTPNPKSRLATYRLETKAVSSEILSEQLVKLHWESATPSPNGMPSIQLLSHFNSTASAVFAGDSDFYVKSIDEVANFDAHQLSFF